MNLFEEQRLVDVCSYLRSGKTITASEISTHGEYPVFGGNGCRGYTTHYNFSGDCAIIGRQGAFCGNVRYFTGNAYMTEHAIIACANNKNNTRYLSYLLSTMNLGRLSGQSAQPGLSVKYLSNVKIFIPSLNIQKKIVSVLSLLDDKIKLNNKINDNLQQQVIALFHQIFDECNHNRKNIRAEEYFDISIGKTQPRKEHQWFSKNSSDCVWVSISDMGSSGLYIENSSEYLTLEAIKKFNIKIVPDNTVILSFKLTVGRVAIADGWMTTNEAIAHFKTDKPEITEYLYCYLKCFNFQTMGSTSSIATAVNSKIIKDMPFIVPTDDELEKFHNIAMPLFMIIKSNQRENKRLTELRDTLLPKLLSGELDVSELDI